MRAVFSFLLGLLSLVVLFWAFHLKDSHLLSIRPYESAILVSLCLLLAAMFRFAPWSFARVMGMGTMLGCVAVVMLAELNLHWQKQAVHAGEIEAARQIGGHLLVGYVEADELKPLVSQGLVGGIFVTRRNLAGKTLEQVRQEIAALQALRSEADLPPLLVAADQEGGLVSHLSPPLLRRPGLASLLADQPNAEELRTRAEH